MKRQKVKRRVSQQVNAMLKWSKKRLMQRKHRPLAIHATETFKEPKS